MTKHILIIFLLAFSQLAVAQNTSSEPEEPIRFEQGSDPVVELVKYLLPERSQAGIDLIPWSFLGKIEELATPDSRFDIASMSDYYSSQEHSPPPKSKFILFDVVFDYFADFSAILIFALALVTGVLFRVYEAINKLLSDDKQVHDEGAKELRGAGMNFFGLSLLVMFVSPLFVDHGAFTYMLVPVLLTTYLSMGIIANGVFSHSVDFSNPYAETDKGLDKIADVQLMLKNNITATMQANLIYDAFLDSSLINHQFPEVDGRMSVTNAGIIGLGEAQQELERLRTGGTTARTDCLLRKDWSQVAHDDKACDWVLSSTPSGVMKSRLAVEYSKPKPRSELTASQERLLGDIEELVNNEIDNYTAYKKAVTCVQTHGQEVNISTLETSFFCRARRDDYSLYDDQFYGYTSDDGLSFKAVSTFSKTSDGYSFAKFDKAIKTLMEQRFDAVAQEKAAASKGEHEARYNRGLLLSLPSFMDIQNDGKKASLIQFAEATDEVMADIIIAKNSLFSSKPQHSKTLQGISDSDEAEDYLSKFFPYAKRIWFQRPVHDVSFSVSDSLSAMITRVDPSNSIGTVVDSIPTLMSFGVLFYGMYGVTEILELDFPILKSLGSLVLMLAVLGQLAILFFFFAFPIKVIFHKIVMRILIGPVALVAMIVGRLIDQVQNPEQLDGHTVFWLDLIKTQIIYPAIHLVLALAPWIFAAMITNQLCAIAIVLIESIPALQGEGLWIKLILNLLLFPAAFTFMIYHLMYKLQFYLNKWLTAGFEDDMPKLSLDDETIMGVAGKAKLTTLMK